MQKLFGNHAGNVHLPATISLSERQEAVNKRIGFSIVQDAKAHSLIVKLVNLLPVSVNTTIDLAGIPLKNDQGVKWTLQGKPEDKKGKSIQAPCTVSKNFNIDLPPYSCTIVRMTMREE